MATILIVDDNPENSDALSRLLKRRGYRVIVVANGRGGVATAASELPDVILMDMNMPDLDGWEATRMIKAEPMTSKIPVIALTAHAMAGDRNRALDAGCVDYHTKPIVLEKLLAQMESILEGNAGQ